MRFHIRIGCGQAGLHRLQAQWLGRLIRRLGHGVEVLPQPDPLVGLGVGYCDAVLVPGPALARMPSQPGLMLAAWLPVPDARIAWCAPAGHNRLRQADFPARVGCWHPAVAAQWQAQHPNHQLVVRSETELPATDSLDGWLLPAETLYHQGLLADATAFPALVPPPAHLAYAVLVAARNHALRDEVALLTDGAVAEHAQLALALAEQLPTGRRPHLAAHVKEGQIQACLATASGIRHASGPADLASVPIIIQSLLTGD